MMKNHMRLVFGVCALAGGAASANATVTMETRFLVQQTSGSGATYTVSDAGTTTFAPNARVRLTVQYRLSTDQPQTEFPLGLASTVFSVMGSGPAGGSVARSQLFGTVAGSPQQMGEAFSTPGGFEYPGVGAVTSPTLLIRTGLHSAFRGGLSDPDGTGPLTADSSVVNGSYAGDDALKTTAISLSSSIFPIPSESSLTDWHGLFSLEFQHSGSLGSKEFAFQPWGDQQVPTGKLLYWDQATTNPLSSLSFSNGSITINFAVPAPASVWGVVALASLLGTRRRSRV